MNQLRAAIYARVSGEQQAAAHTIESQIDALNQRAREDGVPIPPERQFVDDGYSGATLVRPALDRLRDLLILRSWNESTKLTAGRVFLTTLWTP